MLLDTIGEPDIIWWDELSKRSVLVELIICFDTISNRPPREKGGSTLTCVRIAIMKFLSSPLKLALEE